MTTNRERIDKLKFDVQEVSEVIRRLETSSEECWQKMEVNLHELMTAVAGTQQGRKDTKDHQDQGSSLKGGNTKDCENHYHVPPRYMKMDFSRFSGVDPTEWLNWVSPFCAY